MCLFTIHIKPHYACRHQAKNRRSDSMSVNSTQPLLVPERRRYSQQDCSAASPSAATLSPTFNPWYTLCPASPLSAIQNFYRKANNPASLGGSPPVSMREVMAEAEAEQKRRRSQERQKVAARDNEGVHRTHREK